jgi:hypothetical protein
VPVAAGIPDDALVAAILAGLDVTTKGCRAAVLDHRHDLELGEAQCPVWRPVGRASGTEDVCNLERGAHGSAVG